MHLTVVSLCSSLVNWWWQEARQLGRLERESGGCRVFVAGLFYKVVVGFGFFGSSVDLSQLWLVGWWGETKQLLHTG